MLVLRLRITVIWLALILATCLSWEGVQVGWGNDHRVATVGVMIVAFIKVRFVVLDFMEVRRAPYLLRLFFEAWIVLVCAAIIGIYWQGTIHGG